MTHLFAILFFSGILGLAIAALWSAIEAEAERVFAHWPWQVERDSISRVTVNNVRRNGLAC